MSLTNRDRIQRRAWIYGFEALPCRPGFDAYEKTGYGWSIIFIEWQSVGDGWCEQRAVNARRVTVNGTEDTPNNADPIETAIRWLSN